MARRPFKLTKNALTLLGIVVLIIIIFTVIKFGGKQDESVKEVKTSISNVIAENQVLSVKLLDFVSTKDSNNEYLEVSMEINGNDNILGYPLANRQVFNKVMQLTGPDENSLLLNNNSEVPTHEAYILVLTGDLVEYSDDLDNKSYHITNARLDYYKQALLLENDYDSIYIASIDGKKEKMVKIDAYKQALSSPETYLTMLQW